MREKINWIIRQIRYLQSNLRENIEEVFKQGLLLYTQQECINGISREPGKGMYFTEAQNWEIVQEPLE